MSEINSQAMLLMMDGPFEIKTGGKGANSAAAAGQSFRTEFVGQLGAMSEEYNFHLLADLKQFGNVDTERCAVLQGVSTGTAYIAQFEDNDNSVLLIGGANQVGGGGRSTWEREHTHVAIAHTRQIQPSIK